MREQRQEASSAASIYPLEAVGLLPPGFCLNCGHHERDHSDGGYCEVEVKDLDCECPALRLCAACEGDPEAHDLHICGRSA